jgi:ligand-binding sensor domain-containing protein
MDSADGLPSNFVFALAFDLEGRQWFGTDAGVAMRQAGVWSVYTTIHGLGGTIINDLAVDQHGQVWAATNNGVSRFDGAAWHTYSTAHGLLDGEVNALAVAPDGRVWAGSREGVNVFDGESWITYGYEDGLTRSYIRAIAFDEDGQPWVGTGYGVFTFDGVQWQGFNPFGSLHYGQARALDFDADGHLWIACAGAGVFEFVPGAVEVTIPLEGGDFSPSASAQSLRTNGDLVELSLSFGLGDVATDLALMYLPTSDSDRSAFAGVVASFELYGLVSGSSAPRLAETEDAFAMTIRYDELAEAMFQEDSLRLYAWDGAAWVEEPTQGLDTAQNILSAAPTALTHYVLAGQPNPGWRALFLPITRR